MKKKVLILIGIFVTITAIIIGCLMVANDEGIEYIGEESSFNVIDVYNVSMEITEVTPTGITLIITDTNKEHYMYGDWFVIEKEINGKWYKVDTIRDDIAFNAIGYSPNKNNHLNFEYRWESIYGKLPNGSYRIVLMVGTYYSAAEFEIKG